MKFRIGVFIQEKGNFTLYFSRKLIKTLSSDLEWNSGLSTHKMHHVITESARFCYRLLQLGFYQVNVFCTNVVIPSKKLLKMN